MLRGYKLFRVRKDGSIGPLFINAKLRVPVGVPLQAEQHLTAGFAFRPGWHVCSTPSAPHLSKKGRAWFEVMIDDVTEHVRPAAQGGLWYTANVMTVVRQLSAEEAL